jgi:hypothetical protein
MEDSGKSAVQAVRNFIERINDHDVAALNKLTADHFRFVDATGATFHVTEMRKGWKSYFSTVSLLRTQSQRATATCTTSVTPSLPEYCVLRISVPIREHRDFT